MSAEITSTPAGGYYGEIAPVIPSRDDLHACLEEVRRIEALTDYRLVRSQKNDAWVFVARVE